MNDEVQRRIAVTRKEHLPYLDLSGQGLSSVPEEVLTLTWLEALSLSNNAIMDITSLPALHRLKKLALSNNKIENISALASLQELIITSLTSLRLKDMTSSKKLLLLVIGSKTSMS
jgi:Leucine-rich repeat (LRR) protein